MGGIYQLPVGHYRNSQTVGPCYYLQPEPVKPLLKDDEVLHMHNNLVALGTSGGWFRTAVLSELPADTGLQV